MGAVKKLDVGKKYVFRVNAHTLTSQASSEKATFTLSKRLKQKAVTAGVVGGILFFIVAIILAVCTVKCVNKRNKRHQREQEKGNPFLHPFLLLFHPRHFLLHSLPGTQSGISRCLCRNEWAMNDGLFLLLQRTAWWLAPCPTPTAVDRHQEED